MRTVDPHTKLAFLWLFILLNIIFRDIHQFVMPGFIERLMTGEFNGMVITEELMLIGGIVVSVPIGMVPLSYLLARELLRPLTLIAAIITTATMVPPHPVDLDDMYHFSLQLIGIAAILWVDWRWRGSPATNAKASAKGLSAR